MKKTASAVWQGNLQEGKGTISTQSGALKDNPYGFNTRFEGAPGEFEGVSPSYARAGDQPAQFG